MNPLHSPRNEHSKMEFGKKNSKKSLKDRRLFPGANPATGVRAVMTIM